MDTRSLIDLLTRPAAYSHPVERVIVHQTHISAVSLAGPFAYKVKKPVALGFLDFSTPELRRHFCKEEVRLNRRLAPHIYLGVVPITRDGERLQVDGTGEPIDWAVKMVRLPEGTSLLDRIIRGESLFNLIGRLAQFLADFHRRADAGPHIAAFGRFEVVAGNARENYSQCEPHVGTTLSRSVFDRLRALTEHALDQLHPLIESRAARGVPRDTHGDLHLDHVYLDPSRSPPDDLFAIDCIEFNERFRFADPVADLAFLIMDLKFRHCPGFVELLAAAYFEAANDLEGAALLPFYTAYRAAIRGKVEGFELAEPEVPARNKEAAVARARGHWLLALGELDEPARRPALVLVGGLPGTGKSTLAQRLAALGRFNVIRSDVIRKELAGLAPDTPGGQELYTPEWSDRTYAECLRRAERSLFDGQRIIVDATFREDARRRAFLDLAQGLCVPTVVFACEAHPEVVRDRLTTRTGDASDASWEVYCHQRAAWEPPSEVAASAIVTLLTNPGADPLASATTALRQKGML
jgi:aminoglycoside phosphotransferase family enzyme/predicted kinase